MKGAGDDITNPSTPPYQNTKYNIPEYKDPLNNPMIPNDQKKVFQENKKNAPPPKKQDNNQLLNLQLYQPKPKPPANRPPNPAVFYPNYVLNPFDPINYARYMQPPQYDMQPPIYNEYKININGVSGSQLRMATIYEDAMPIKNVATTFTSIGERIIMYEYIRALIFSKGDGQDMPIDEKSHGLISYIKFMDFNPYNTSIISNNPYRGLPYGFLLYRSCYPIRHDSRNLSTMCSSTSTGINIRIYRLSEGGYMINKQNLLSITNYDEWRDIGFYNFVKEYIIKKKICPNFTIMYGYNITLKSDINFDELINFINRGRINNANASTYDILRQQQLNQLRSSTLMVQHQNPITGAITQQPTILSTIDRQMIMLNHYTGKVIVCLTEASNYSIIGWAKKQYKSDGNIKRMIIPGYHSKIVWNSVLFQMFAAIYTMQTKGIVINNFDIARNVYIKDISSGGNITNYWKYKIDGIEYYIPNCGYLVLIDTNFRDYDVAYNGNDLDPNRERKLDGKFIGANSKLNDNDIMEKTFEMFINSVDTNNFGQSFVDDNGIKPPEEILGLLGNIKNEVDSKPTLNISFYIRRYMTMFLNNRVGTLLSENEINNIKIGAIKEFRRGQIVVTIDENGVNRFVIHVETKDDGIARIITRDKIDINNSNIIEKDVPVTSLYEYSIVDPIKQNFNINEVNLNDDSLIETYNIE